MKIHPATVLDANLWLRYFIDQKITTYLAKNEYYGFIQELLKSFELYKNQIVIPKIEDLIKEERENRMKGIFKPKYWFLQACLDLTNI